MHWPACSPVVDCFAEAAIFSADQKRTHSNAVATDKEGTDGMKRVT